MPAEEEEIIILVDRFHDCCQNADQVFWKINLTPGCIMDVSPCFTRCQTQQYIHFRC